MSVSESSPRVIAIVGGGLSGALVAANLLKRAQAAVHIYLIERTPPLGRGVAYGTESAGHLLNVPAGRMSAWPDEPGHFLAWVGERVGRIGYPESVTADDFVPRQLYGDYIGAVLLDARGKAHRDVKFTNVTGEAIDLEERPDGRARVTLEDGRQIEADRVVLALGNLPGEYPIKRALPFYHGRRYVHVPWRPGALEGIGRREDVLIVGAGLTATDILVRLSELGHTGTVHALSRNGLRPVVHQGTQTEVFPAGTVFPTTVRGVLRLLRETVERVSAKGGNWRSVVDGIRPYSQAIWQGFSWADRARFMRHVRPFWEVHRHRIAPSTAATLKALSASGRVTFHAGRLVKLTELPDGAEATFRVRGTDNVVSLKIAKVINCTGPRTDYSKYQHPLLINLLARGLIDHDPLALGINALPSGEVFRYKGPASGWLFTLGAPLKGVLWESTAVREIRVQAGELAATLLNG